MPITLNHTIVPAHDKEAAARFFARIFGLRFEGASGHFAPVHVNDTLTLLFDQETDFDSHHYAFHVDDGEFDAILGRVKAEGPALTAARPGASTTASSTTGTAAAACTSRTPTAISSS